LVAVRVGRFRAGNARHFDRAAELALGLSRAGLYVLVFFVLHIAARGDVVGFYFPEAERALHGAVPYVNLLTSYAPLHPYLDGVAVLLWRSPLSIVLLAIVFELLLLPVWLGFARAFFSEQQVRTATLLYIASPISLQFVATDGQDNVIIAVLLALAVYCVYRGRTLLSGAAVGLGVIFVKFLPLLFVPVFAMGVSRQLSRRVRWLAGLALVLVLGYAPFALLHGNLLYPLLFEGQERTASNLPYVVEAVLGLGAHPRAEDGLLLLTIAGILAVSAKALYGAELEARVRVMTFAPAALTLALLMLSKKSWPPYLMLVLFPLCLLFGEGRYRGVRTLAFGIFSVLAVFVHSLWATVFQQALAPELHAMLAAGRPSALAFLLLQVLLVGGYLWLLAACVLQVARAGGDAGGGRELAG
jgi:hypothetical protein